MIAAFRRRLLGGRRRPARPPRPSRVGTAAPGLSGWTPGGDPVRIDTGSGRVVVAFLTSSCAPCVAFWKALRDEPVDANRVSWPPPVVVVTPDSTTEDRREVARLAPASTPVVMSSDGWITWGVSGSPFFVVVADGMIVAEGVAADWDGMLGLLPAR